MTLGRRFDPVLCVSVMNVSHVDVPENEKEALHNSLMHFSYSKFLHIHMWHYENDREIHCKITNGIHYHQDFASRQYACTVYGR